MHSQAEAMLLPKARSNYESMPHYEIALAWLQYAQLSAIQWCVVQDEITSTTPNGSFPIFRLQQRQEEFVHM